MSWNDQGGGGPWGSGQGPWGQRGGKDSSKPSSGPDNASAGVGRLSPRMDALLERLRRGWRERPSRPSGSSVLLLAAGAVVLLLWLASGIYRVQPDEEGVVLRFGAYEETTKPGLHYHWPRPFETVLTPTVTRVRRTDIGFDAEVDGNSGQLLEEALMLTGDENIVDINLSVFWTVKDARAYLFNIRNPDATVKSASESAIREVVGQNPIAPVLAEGRAKIETHTMQLLQSILDGYNAGVKITEVQLQKADPPQPVIEAFRDVQRARTDLERLRNEAEAYANDVVPRARGDAARQVQQAEAYKREVVARAEGDAQRFDQIFRAWSAAKDVTSERLYLDTMEDVLQGASKVILDRNASASGVLPYLPLGASGVPRLDKPGGGSASAEDRAASSPGTEPSRDSAPAASAEVDAQGSHQ